MEDEEDIRTISELALQLGGFTVKCCSAGKEALQVCLEFKPDLIVMDVMMPGMDGPSTLKVLRQEEATKSIPVIFMTAEAQKQEIENFIKLGVLDVILKPFNPITLAAHIKKIWNKSHE